jgi:hypothetical protein
MATIATNRASFQHVNTQMRVGKPKRTVLSQVEQANLRKAISCLQKAVDATDDSAAMINMTTAFNLTRTVILDNK